MDIDDSLASWILLRFAGIWRIKMGFLKWLFCKHDYAYQYDHMVDTGMRKLYRLTCKKCGKEKYKVL